MSLSFNKAPVSTNEPIYTGVRGFIRVLYYFVVAVVFFSLDELKKTLIYESV